MRVLAAIVVPPHLSVSGGARAAELLSSALMEHCDMTVASMMNGEGLRVGTGRPPAGAGDGEKLVAAGCAVVEILQSLQHVVLSFGHPEDHPRGQVRPRPHP